MGSSRNRFLITSVGPKRKGNTGDSAYELAVKEGYTGTLDQWLASLKGDKGDTGEKGDDGTPGVNGADGIGGVVAVKGSGTYAQTSGTVQFSNANGITFGLSTNGVMTASHNGLTVQTGNFASTNHVHDTLYPLNSLFSGTNISATINSTAFNLSVAASGNSTSFGSQSATPSQTTGASSVLANNGGWVTVVTVQSGNFLSTNAASAYVLNSLFSGTNISGTVNSSSFALSVAPPPTVLAAHAGTQFSGTNVSATVNSTALQLSVAAPVVTTGLVAASTFTGTNITGTANSGGWSLQGAVGAGFSGTNVSGTVNATGIQLSAAAQPTVLAAHAGTAFSGTNISGTVNSTALQLSVAAAPTVLAAHAGTAFSGTNISATVNSTALQLSVAASGNSTSFAYQSATPSQTTGASSVLYNNGEWKTVAAGGGIQSINGQTAAAQTITVQSGLALSTATNAWTFGLSSNYINASVINTTGASSSFLAADGTYRTVAAGGVTNNYTGVVAHGLSASTTNNATFGSIWYQGTNVTINLTTDANSSHVMNFSVAAPPTVKNFIFPQDVWYGNIVTTLSTPISTNITIRPIKIPYTIEFSKMEWPVSIAVASTTNTNASTQELRHTAVIYSKNGAILEPIVGAAVTYSYTVSTNSTGSVAGARFLSAPLATTLTPGDYWIGLQAQTAGQQAMTLNHILVSQGSGVANFLRDGQSITTAAFASTGPFNGAPLQGVIVASLSATTNTWNINQISVAPATYYRANMIFQFKNVTY